MREMVKFSTQKSLDLIGKYRYKYIIYLAEGDQIRVPGGVRCFLSPEPRFFWPEWPSVMLRSINLSGM